MVAENEAAMRSARRRVSSSTNSGGTADIVVSSQWAKKRHSRFISVGSTGLDRSCGALTAAAMAIIILAVVAYYIVR
jgi:hypothetical protein